MVKALVLITIMKLKPLIFVAGDDVVKKSVFLFASKIRMRKQTGGNW